MIPETLDEWGAYISRLEGEELWSKAIAANTLEFVQVLQEEGFEPSEIAQILIMFGQQFTLTDQAMPMDMPGQYLSYPALLESVGA